MAEAVARGYREYREGYRDNHALYYNETIYPSDTDIGNCVSRASQVAWDLLNGGLVNMDFLGSDIVNAINVFCQHTPREQLLQSVSIVKMIRDYVGKEELAVNAEALNNQFKEPLIHFMVSIKLPAPYEQMLIDFSSGTRKIVSRVIYEEHYRDECDTQYNLWNAKRTKGGARKYYKNKPYLFEINYWSMGSIEKLIKSKGPLDLTLNALDCYVGYMINLEYTKYTKRGYKTNKVQVAITRYFATGLNCYYEDCGDIQQIKDLYSAHRPSARGIMSCLEFIIH